MAKATQHLLEEMDRRNKNLEELIGAAISRLGQRWSQPASGGVDAAVMQSTPPSDPSQECGRGRTLSAQAIGEALKEANLRPLDVNSSKTVREKGGEWDGRPDYGDINCAGSIGSSDSLAQLGDVEALVNHGSDLEQLSMVAESPAAPSSQNFNRGSLDENGEQCA